MSAGRAVRLFLPPLLLYFGLVEVRGFGLAEVHDVVAVVGEAGGVAVGGGVGGWDNRQPGMCIILFFFSES